MVDFLYLKVHFYVQSSWFSTYLQYKGSKSPDFRNPSDVSIHFYTLHAPESKKNVAKTDAIERICS